MSDIKAGDLVMVVRPTLCCGGLKNIGRVFVVQYVGNYRSSCSRCGHCCIEVMADIDGEWSVEIERLKKIDPPAEGDSLPTRREIEVTA